MANDRIESKIDKIQEDVNDIKVTLALNTSSLQEHMKRTAIAEERLESYKNELEPIKDHIKKVNWTFIILSVLGSIILGLKSLGINFLSDIINKIN